MRQSDAEMHLSFRTLYNTGLVVEIRPYCGQWLGGQGDRSNSEPNGRTSDSRFALSCLDVPLSGAKSQGHRDAWTSLIVRGKMPPTLPLCKGITLILLRR